MTPELSRDVLFTIFSNLSKEDLFCVSLCCKQFNDVCRPLLYATVHLTWEDIEAIAIDIEQKEHYDCRLAHTRKVLISANGRGEWKSSPKLGLLAEANKGCLSALGVTCQLSSSGWFKYIPTLAFIKSLELTTAGACANYTFDFEHVSQTLPNLERVKLGGPEGGFLIDPFPDSGLVHLRHLSVENCQWQYPAKLCDAGGNSELETLELRYTQEMHAFAFSERLRAEFKSLPLSLQNLEVHIDVGMKLKWNPLTRSRGLPNLECAKLSGFEFPYSFSKEKAQKFPKLRTLSEVGCA